MFLPLDTPNSQWIVAKYLTRQCADLYVSSSASVLLGTLVMTCAAPIPRSVGLASL
jgi:hypothetical protein